MRSTESRERSATTEAAETAAIPPPSRLLLALEFRAAAEFALFALARPLLARAPRGDGHAVLALPGLFASDHSMAPMRRFLRAQGYEAHGWGQGRNRGPRPGVIEALLDRLRALRRASGRRVSLVGWSLGGVYARQLAKLAPEDVRLVIALGSPFGGGPQSTNAWRAYEWISGLKVADRDALAGGPLAAPPAAPFTAIVSRGDGVCGWRPCRAAAGPLCETIEVRGSHLGLPFNPAALWVVADRLAQPEAQWRPFERGHGWRSLVYPDPDRA